MKPTRWEEISRLYQAALACEATERRALLAEACAGDESLRREVESLLTQQTSDGGLLNESFGVVAAQLVGDAGASVLTGRRLGAYQVQTRLGAGGMGEVYRARDTRLGRDVAIKILPRSFTSDPDRLARFDREARVLASLNHPHIAAIYGLEESEGMPALVLELVEGESLSARIERGPIPLKQALTIARQIADALDTAHERGIVHRDLKPANVMITPDGVVKILDFGLAKAVTGADAGPDLTHTPTMTSGGTREGVMLGTPAYMSPEQARGQSVDTRTDIWAFGCVVYEMLTGHRAFAGQTLSDTIAAVLEHDPDWSRLPADTPRVVRRVLARCLEKEPKRRVRDVADAQAEIDDSMNETFPSAPLPARTAHRRIGVWATASVAAAALATIVAVVLSMRAEPTAQPMTRTTVLFPTEQELDRRAAGYPLRLSADGTRLVYLATKGSVTQMYVRDLNALEPKLIPGTEGARQPFFSNDGNAIGFFAGGLLKKVAVTGGLPLQVSVVSSAVRGASWGADGTIVFASAGGGLFKVSSAGGEPQPIPGSEGAAWPEILPDGKVLFTADGKAFVTMALDGSAKRVLARRSDVGGDGAPLLGTAYLLQAHYVSTGHLLYGQGPGVLLAVAFDLRTSQIKGPPVSLIDSVFEAPGAGAVYFTVSDTGSLAYAPENRDRELIWVDRNGRETPVPVERQAFRFPRLSPEGKRVAVSIDDDTRRSDIWIYDIEHGTRRRLTSDQHNLAPVWTPDGLRIAYYRSASVWWQPVEGNTPPEILVKGPDFTPMSWSPDGRELLFGRNRPDTPSELFILPRDRIDSPRELLVRSFADLDARFSPDGRAIAFVSDESGRPDVFVMRYPELQPKVAISTAGGNSPAWSPDGRELFYRQNMGMMSVAVDVTRGLEVGAPRLLFPGSSYVGAGGDESFDLGPDGQRFLMTKILDPSTSRQLVVVQSWFEELKRRVPQSGR